MDRKVEIFEVLTPIGIQYLRDIVTELYRFAFSNEVYKASVVDDGLLTFTPPTAGFGLAMAGDAEEYGLFTFSSAAAITLIANSANTVNTDTDAKFCIYDTGTAIGFKNRLAATKDITYWVFWP